MDMREGLARRLVSGAAWRTAESKKHPEDDGNRRSADALTDLAGHVMTLRATDHRLETMAGLSIGEDAFPSSGDDVDQLIVRYGANRRLQADPDTFLRDLVGLADRNGRTSRRNRRSDISESK
jgi:hypothetical protein